MYVWSVETRITLRFCGDIKSFEKNTRILIRKEEHRAEEAIDGGKATRRNFSDRS